MLGETVMKSAGREGQEAGMILISGEALIDLIPDPDGRAL